jgi:hypothetical protein
MERLAEEVVVTCPGAPSCNILDKPKKIVNMTNSKQSNWNINLILFIPCNVHNQFLTLKLKRHNIFPQLFTLYHTEY